MTLLRHLVVASLCALLAGCGLPSAGADARDGNPAPFTTVDERAAELNRIRPVTADAAPQLPVTVTSADGERVEIADVSRIVPLNGSLAEIVFSLGLGDRVVGRDASTTFAEAEQLPLVSKGHDVSAEGVLALRPTVVLGDTRTGPVETLDQLRSAGVPVVLFEEAWTIDDIAPRIDAVAAALGVPDAGTTLAERTHAEIAAADRTPATGAAPLRVAFLYLRGTAGIYLLGGEGSGADAMIEAAGAVDVGSEARLKPFTPLTSEALVAARPDVILVMEEGLRSVGGIDGLVGLAGVAQTPAGRDRRVVAVDDGLLLNFGPRTGGALLLLAEGLYPSQGSG